MGVKNDISWSELKEGQDLENREANPHHQEFQGAPPSPPGLFLENFRYNFKFYESENFSDSSLHRLFESENFRFPFPTKNSLTCGLKCEKLNLIRKS